MSKQTLDLVLSNNWNFTKYIILGILQPGCLFVWYCFLVNVNTNYYSRGTKNMDLLCRLNSDDKWIVLYFVGLQNFCVITVSTKWVYVPLEYWLRFSTTWRICGFESLKISPTVRGLIKQIKYLIALLIWNRMSWFGFPLDFKRLTSCNH